ncbi:zinc finger protein ZAT5-like [Momordica charantia]|uniref:Zinc finger protein ZAT5-like n=1 Tax=Momordica charantia TaxID=3673 RepID=A0A6J1CU34_MOMCH|nr:zinc finger protein ZAT5-like [Momordica charantia]
MAETPASPGDEIEAQFMTIKGKRSKRQRPSSPSHSSSTGDQYYCSSSSVCVEAEEDQDMANCLILLAQGREKLSSSSSLYLYQCKTCERCFPSFQALGGHRASHKKPKNNVNSAQQQHHDAAAAIRLSLELSSATDKPIKVHECSICGAEFSSGQALGGHMRRHRPLTTAANRSTTTPALREFMIKKERAVLELDLNLPAPEDDRHRPAVTVFSAASPLVDCHY